MRGEMTDVAAAMMVLLCRAGGRGVYKAAQRVAREMPLPADETLADFIKALRGCSPFCLEASTYLADEAERALRYLEAQRGDLLAAVRAEVGDE